MKYTYILLFSLLIFSCGNKESAPETEKTEKTEKNTQIQISIAQFEKENMQLEMPTEHAFTTVVKTNGIIDVPPENKASISSFVGGYVTKIPLLVGDKVKKGQLVATLENTEFVEIQQQYLEISAQLSFLKNEFSRQKTLFDEKITSEKNFLKAESNYRSSLANYKGLRKKLEMMHINPNTLEAGKITASINLYSPINGFVTKVNVTNGGFVSATNPLFEIINTDHIHLELAVFEKDILKIKKDQKIRFKIPESSEKNFDATVYLMGTAINQNRTINVHGHITDQKNNNFISGMFVEASIIYKSQKEISLPKTGILKTASNYVGLVFNRKTDTAYIFDKVNLETGLENENFIQITNYKSIKDRKMLTKGIFKVLN